MVAWQDWRFADQPTVFVTRARVDAGVQAARVVAMGASKPSLAAHAGLTAIAWEQREEAWVRLLAADDQWASPPVELGGRCPAVAFGPLGALVVFEEGRLKAAHVAADGRVLSVVPLSPGNVPWGTCARVSADPQGHFAVAWRNGNDLFAATLSMTMTTATVGAPAVVDTGTPGGSRLLELEALGPFRWQLLAGWSVMAPTVRLSAYELGAAVGGAVSVLPDNEWTGLDAVPCGDRLCVVAQRGDSSPTLDLARMEDGGFSVAASFAAASTDWAVGGAADAGFLWWAESTERNVTAQTGTFVATPVSAPQVLSDAPAAHLAPRVAWHGATALVAWLQPTGANTLEVLARRYDARGVPLDATPFALGGARTRYDLLELHPSPGGWLAVLLDSWSGATSLQSISPDGTVGAERRLATTAYTLGAALEGERVLLAMKNTANGTQWDPVLVTVEPDGGESVVRVVDSAYKEDAPDVAITGTGERLVVFQDRDPLGQADPIIAGVRVSPAGQVLDPMPFRVSPPGAPSAFDPEVVSDGDAGFIVVWKSYSLLYAQHVVGTTASEPYSFAADRVDAPITQHQLVAAPGGGAVVVYATQADGGVATQDLSLGPAGLDAGQPVSFGAAGFNAWPGVGLAPGRAAFAFSVADLTQNTMLGRVRVFTTEPADAPCTAPGCASRVAAPAAAARPLRWPMRQATGRWRATRRLPPSSGS